MALNLRKEWVWALIGAGLALLALLVWAWVDGGIEPVRPLTAPANLGGGAA